MKIRAILIVLAMAVILPVAGCYSGGINWPPYFSSPMMSYETDRQAFDKRELTERYPQLEGIVITAHEYMEEMEKAEKDAKEKGSESPEEFRIGQMHTLQITVWGEPELATNTQPRPDGKIDFPYIGEVYVVGKTIKELKNELRERLKEYIINPQIILHMSTPTYLPSEFSGTKGTAIGNVAIFGSSGGAGGLIYIPGPQKLSRVLALSGALGTDSDIRQIRVIKPSIRKVVVVDWFSFVRDMDWRQDITVTVDDIIVIPQMWSKGVQFEKDWDTVLRYMGGIISFHSFYDFMVKRY